MLKMDKLDLIFERMVFSRNKSQFVIYIGLQRQLSIGKLAMATFKLIQLGNLTFRLIQLENNFSDPIFYFELFDQLFKNSVVPICPFSTF